MCGIAGFLSRNFNQVDLSRIVGSISHRGPDAEGFYFDASDGIGLGHRRLSIIDLSEAANQPFYSADKRYALVFNGEIYNFRDLISKYNLKTRTSSDTEVIIELFSLYGPESVSELNGMFAMAIWDTHKKELFIFRDRFGVKPLFYFQSDNDFVFSSELKSIQQNFKERLQIDEQAFGYYFHYGFIPCPNTVYKNVRKLEPGGYIHLKNGEFNLLKFVQLADFVKPSTVTNEEEAINELEDLLIKSVKRQTIADVPLGVFLSGGTDSSLVAALTSKVSDNRIKTFSVGFSNSNFDELPYAKAVAQYLNTEHYEIHVTDKQMLDRLYEIIDAYDEPYMISSGFPTFSISEFTRKHVTVGLSGEGSDEMFMGYGFHLWAKKMNQFPIKQFGNLIGAGLKMSKNPAYKQKGRLFTNPGKYFQQGHIFSEEQIYFSIDEIAQHFSPSVGGAVSNYSIPFPSAREFKAEEKQSWFDINVYLVDDLLTKIDRASMHYGLEARVPFLDNDLFSYVINLDSNFKLDENGTGKALLKKVLYRHIPKEYFNRRKWGFAPPLSKWLKADLKQVVDTYLDPAVVKKFGIVSSEFVQQTRKDYERNDRYCNKVWLLVLIHIWLTRHA